MSINADRFQQIAPSWNVGSLEKVAGKERNRPSLEVFMSGSSAYDQDRLRTRARWAECTKILHSDRLENVARHTLLTISLRLSCLTLPVAASQRMSWRQWHNRPTFFNLAIELESSSSLFKPNGSLTARTPAEPNAWCLVRCCGTHYHWVSVMYHRHWLSSAHN